MFVLFFTLLVTLANSSLCARTCKDKKVHEEALRWLVSEGVDPNIKRIVLEYVVPFQVIQISQIGLLKNKQLWRRGRSSLPKMIALGHSELALVKDGTVHGMNLDETSEITRIKRRGATPTAINYCGANMDRLLVAFDDGKVLGYLGKRVDFAVDTRKTLEAVTTSDGVLYGASEEGIDTWSIQENALLSSCPLNETVDNLHAQGRALFIHTTRFNHYVLEENAKKPTLLDTGCRTVSYGAALGERLCYGAHKEVTYYPSIKDRVPSWEIHHAKIIGAKLVPREKAAMIILDIGIELVGTEDHELVYTSTFKGTFNSLPAGDVDVMRSGSTSAVMIREDGDGSRGTIVYRVVERGKMIQKIVDGRSPSLCIIL